MSDQPAEPEGLTDEQISPDAGPGALTDPEEASDPDIRNTTADQDDADDETDAPGS
jgi:hypothetical protein